MRTYTEMESHEEKLHKMIIQSKINDTKDVMKRKAAEIEKSKVERKVPSACALQPACIRCRPLVPSSLLALRARRGAVAAAFASGRVGTNRAAAAAAGGTGVPVQRVATWAADAWLTGG